MYVDYELYRIFHCVAAAGSFTRGAEELNITQSAVSQAIKNLESRLGTALFLRDGRKVRLSREGEMLFHHVARGVSSFSDGERLIKEMAGFDSGEARIGVSDTICRYHLVPLFREFAETYPGIRIQVKNRTSTGILSLLQGGSIDFGIITIPPGAASFKIRPFKTVRDLFVASAKYNELKDMELSLNELPAYPLLLLNSESTTRRLLDSFLDNNGVTAVPSMELESIDLLVEFAKIGFGIAHVEERSVEPAFSSGDLFMVRTDPPLPQRELGIVSLGATLPSRAALLMRDFLLSHGTAH